MSSILTEIAKGQTIEAAKKITNKQVAEALEGLPKNKLHCSNLGADALQMAIRDYEARKQGKPLKPEPETNNSNDHHVHEKEDGCYCPYCDTAIQSSVEFCDACQRSLKDEH